MGDLKKNRYKIIGSYIISLFLVFMLLNSFSSTTYASSSLTDVPKEAYYYESVSSMYERGIIKGYPNSIFKPLNNITVAEAITLIFRISDISYSETANAPVWYYDIMETAKQMQIVPRDVDPNAPANRLNIGEYIITVYGIDASKTKHSNVFSDTDSLVANTMYEYGVFRGVPTKDGFAYMPYEPITRADLCVVLDRLEHLTFPHKNEIPVNPVTYDDVLLVMEALYKSGSNTMTVPYTSGYLSASSSSGIMDNYSKAYGEYHHKYPQFFSFYSSLRLEGKMSSLGDGNITVYLNNAHGIEQERLSDMRDKFNRKTETVINELKDSGKLRDSMASLDKLRILFEYVAINTEYDTSYTPEGYTGYGAAINNRAVCQGYTAFFNNLCQQLGFETEGVSGTIVQTGGEHIWSRVKVNGNWRYFDVTFSDPIPDRPGYCNFDWFNLSYDEIMGDRTTE